jgi:DNA invertase Pin-like site-specific DNA recombinase
MSMKLGYARVSTRDQQAHLQHDALRAVGCERIFTEVASGARTDRPVLAELLAHVRPGDVVVVWKLDRLGRSLKHLVETVALLMEKGAGLQSLQDPVDTTTAQGRLVFNLFASLAEFERDLIRERTHAGLAAARARGRVGGRPRGLSRSSEITAHAAATLYREGKLSIGQICEKLSISRSTLYAYLRFNQVPIGTYKKREGGKS